uniref:Mitochondrial F1F0 ATP synthase associated 14 kDa protein n=2 Tax=Polytomella TaxID=3049 RepID=A0A024FSR7_9CHLO|nr:Chain 5, Mitochondrial F1F0 ATP synthase associated 14 kDa protein [Polytomella sp. Pringsheim 198.80]6RD5_5 Chain 5, Mitochondrial F1F0 ATP synthase associated 14 kDa protein [Polytomella sp. Pringsheim 198.80]6RD7_5 Chain 5, Mitochondrial F1F0 ATP synthase associated 14 kDa protein [Polytomella sp. Pringsheim 198.80]6RD8_5 Chain 5, Mitochondrial F1F0 ATP synthase associated 14 kDa protein [Polytomella sp. Pringsheim 198.80]6RD9_5 Chain 5, Mitochondrial F1F0 ATP synthase associated 14 kDa p|mmetsp:Transcript_2127/g.3199  ORF Transcript_2127/g.3199 Transcript_2127/m.3199 type:complete len:124 (-) Transcript_2127:778-1149(-)|eukprot:CAMPEP_0175064442 /NCGR_PEP_ID=MMETSP0052_2-20121109/15335_1 /TAXON_ID=51329 ORGANISM="Polytomella parva, Strain SAG 63-3" /NCGR_SAMPLE_ID=MMETSP0052_2 /ASSEMBLY_ACC=CAM_ASM_000194 /LENGTH=123 /DNA_ID=CAMNT_0016330793 /DNA_START=56 /DNA_END=427 /DNA_ORIENTATION=-
MKLLPESLQQEAATAAVVASWVLWHLDTQLLPTIMREHKLHACWAAAAKRYNEKLFKLNPSYDRVLSLPAVSKNQVLENVFHTAPKAPVEHLEKMVSANSKVYDALNLQSKRVLIWQVKPALF